MRKLSVFNHISLDGFFTDAHNDMSFAQNPKPDKEWDDFVNGNAGKGGTILFGRVTYEMMASYWPTPIAKASMPIVAETMNGSSKVVFSRTMDKAGWANTQLVKQDIARFVRELKASPGGDMIIFGSGTIVSQLTQAGLIDNYQFIVDPVVLGKGRTLFEGIKGKVPLLLTDSRCFQNGNMLLSYTYSKNGQ